jgi:hypothetical protein
MQEIYSPFLGFFPEDAEKLAEDKGLGAIPLQQDLSLRYSEPNGFCRTFSNHSESSKKSLKFDAFSKNLLDNVVSSLRCSTSY